MSEFPYVPIISSTKSNDSPNKGAASLVSLDTTPYPDVNQALPDPETVEVIKGVRTGSGGEFTAIAQYIYQNNRITNNEAFTNAMLQIALVEMMHLDMLGDAIQALGGKPTFDDGKYYWQAGEVNYADTLVDMLKADIASEEGAIADYERAITMTQNEEVKALFRRIIEDEKQHLRFFREMLNKVEA